MDQQNGQKKQSIIKWAIYSYLLAIFLATLLSPIIFAKLYKYIFKPSSLPLGGFLFPNVDVNYYLDGFILVYFILLTFFIFLLLPRKKWLVWLIGVIIPLVILLQDLKYFGIALLLSLLGFLLAQLVLLIKKVLQKRK